MIDYLALTKDEEIAEALSSLNGICNLYGHEALTNEKSDKLNNTSSYTTDFVIFNVGSGDRMELLV